MGTNGGKGNWQRAGELFPGYGEMLMTCFDSGGNSQIDVIITEIALGLIPRNICRPAEGVESCSQSFDRPQAGSHFPVEVTIPAKAHLCNHFKKSQT